MLPTLLQPQEQVLTTLNRDGSRHWLYPRLSPGRFLAARRTVGYVLILIFTLIPHLRLNGRPLMLLDIPRREFTLFGATFLPTDTVLLALFMIGLVTSIFLITALLGRVWCGWACPQTVYMEFLYRPLERVFDGPPGAGGKQGKKRTAVRTFAKYVVFLLASMFLAHTFLAYFVGVDALAQWVRQSPFHHPGPFLVMCIVTAAMMFDFSYFREQTCLVACPYGRFQSVMLDRDSLIISYDPRRGEPRISLRVLKAARSTNATADSSAAKVGDCVDCNLCVDTCPTGIDIRKGLQMECIGCAQCIDACDNVMTKIGRPKGLIRYSSQAGIDGKPVRILRPRLAIYAVVLTAILGGFTFVAATRAKLDISLLRGPGMPYSILDTGEVANLVRLKVVNRTEAPMTVRLELADASLGRLITSATSFAIEPRQTFQEGIQIAIPREKFQRTEMMINLKLIDETGAERIVTHRLLGPGPSAAKPARSAPAASSESKP
ncbi:MAG: cytochrome c oxidase accessory protein CcoG [Phycisphaerae bacterium]|nr:cytochrome c oxidase accessory protein CcoG [Phycisphaerae bacterium]